MIPKIEAIQNEREKRQFAARSNRDNEITLLDAEKSKENVFLHTFWDIYNKSQERKEQK